MATVDIISDGRVIFGVGAGWHEAEFNNDVGRFPPVGEIEKTASSFPL